MIRLRNSLELGILCPVYCGYKNAQVRAGFGTNVIKKGELCHLQNF